jgi:hypothetical protein
MKEKLETFIKSLSAEDREQTLQEVTSYIVNEVSD